MSVEEDAVRKALDCVDKDREVLEGDPLHHDQWALAAYRSGRRLSIDIEIMSPDLTERELQMCRLGRVA